MKFKESEKRELKKSTSELKEAVISITAILNKHRGGDLYFGIGNDGTIIGQTVTGKTVRDVSKAISEHIEPRIYPKVERIEIDSWDCIKVEFHGEEIPYFAYGRAYNPGTFPEGYTPEDFITGKERSILRNHLIAETLYKSKEIEKWGSGLKRIYGECRSNGVKVEFE